MASGQNWPKKVFHKFSFPTRSTSAPRSARLNHPALQPRYGGFWKQTRSRHFETKSRCVKLAMAFWSWRMSCPVPTRENPPVSSTNIRNIQKSDIVPINSPMPSCKTCSRCDHSVKQIQLQSCLITMLTYPCLFILTLLIYLQRNSWIYSARQTDDQKTAKEGKSEGKQA